MKEKGIHRFIKMKDILIELAQKIKTDEVGVKVEHDIEEYIYKHVFDIVSLSYLYLAYCTLYEVHNGTITNNYEDTKIYYETKLLAMAIIKAYEKNNETKEKSNLEIMDYLLNMEA